MNTPKAFHGTPSLHPHRVSAQPARVVEGPVRLPPPAYLGTETMRVSITRHVTLSGDLVRALHLKPGQLLDLKPQRRGLWLLDTRARIGTPLTHTKASRPQFRTAHHIGREHMTVCRQEGPNGYGRGNLLCEVRSTITLVLVGEDPAQPGVFQFKRR